MVEGESVNGLRDVKRYGQQRMSAALANLCIGLVIAIAVLTAYSLFGGTPAQRITMTPAEYRQAISQARIDAAREALNAVRQECILGWTTNPARPARLP